MKLGLDEKGCPSHPARKFMTIRMWERGNDPKDLLVRSGLTVDDIVAEVIEHV